MNVWWFVTRSSQMQPVWRGSKWATGTLPPPPLRLVTTNCDYGLDCDTTSDCYLKLECSLPPPHTTLWPPMNTTQPRQGGLPWTRKRAEGDCGGRVPITTIPHSYGAAGSARAPLLPRPRKQECPVRGGVKSHMPPHLYFSPPTDPSIGPCQMYCNNYLLNFLHHSVSITAYCTLNNIHCSPITYWTQTELACMTLQKLWTGWPYKPSKITWWEA